MGPRGCEATKKVFMIRLLKYANRTALYAAFVDEFGVRIKARDKSIPGRFFIYKLKPRWVQKYPEKVFSYFIIQKTLHLQYNAHQNLNITYLKLENSSIIFLLRDILRSL